jgi:DNA-binding MarR family transcriptional regulator
VHGAPDDDGSLAGAFWLVARRLRHQSREALAPYGVSLSQLRALEVLLRHGGLRPGELAEHLRIAPRSATEVVDALADRGLVERRPDPADRRAKLICPTQRGLAQMSAADGIMAAIQERHARRLGREAYADFKATLMDITEYQRTRTAD